jgi:alpha-N-acetylglucosamine transferase
LAVADDYSGLHADLVLQHVPNRGYNYFFVFPGRRSDDPYRGLWITVSKKDLSCPDDLFRSSL